MRTLKTITLILSVVFISVSAINPKTDTISNNTSEEVITYKIQVGTFFNNNIDNDYYKSLCCDLTKEENTSTIKYLIGDYNSKTHADYALEVVRKKIVNDAFIVPYVNNRRTTFKELKMLTAK